MKGTPLASQGQIDLFKQSFREEAREALVDLESALLELNNEPANRGLVDRVFRGLHTLKGSGAMFGFEALAAFTHDLETAFDEVRNDRLQIGTELIDLTLAALDLMPAMLQSDSRENLAAGAPACAALIEKVRRIAGIHEPSPEAGSSKPSSVHVQQAAGPQFVRHIQFAPGPDLLLCGANPLLLLQELRQMGGLSIRASMAAVPALADIDPERCYVTWEMALATTAGLEAIRDVFIFVEDSCQLSIEPAGDDNVASGQAGERVDKALEEGRVSPARTSPLLKRAALSSSPMKAMLAW